MGNKKAGTFDPNRPLSVLLCSRNTLAEACDQYKLGVASGDGVPVLQERLLAHFGVSFEEGVCPSACVPAASEPGTSAEALGSAVSRGSQDVLAEVWREVRTLTRRLSSVEQENAELKGRLSSLEATAKAQKDEVTAVAVQVSELTTVGAAAPAASQLPAGELQERQSRASNVKLTWVPEGDNESESDTLELAKEIADVIGVPTTAIRTAARVGARRSPSAATSNAGMPRPRPIVVHCESEEAALGWLRERKNLRDSARFARIGVDRHLTFLQQQLKSAVYPEYRKAKEAKKKFWWRDEKLFVEGKHIAPPALP